MADDAETSHGTLRRIADVLGIPLESLFDGTATEPLDGTLQCLMLWQSIRSPTARRKALAYLSQLAEDEMKGSQPVAIGVASRED